jgi:hypothetical protein
MCACMRVSVCVCVCVSMCVRACECAGAYLCMYVCRSDDVSASESDAGNALPCSSAVEVNNCAPLAVMMFDDIFSLHACVIIRTTK